jgi:hypothetical protein
VARTKAFTVRVELENAGPAAHRFDADTPAPAVLAVILALEKDLPSGEVQLGTLRWRFGNRVELLEAIEAAREEAVYADETASRGGIPPDIGAPNAWPHGT